ncbi:MAG: hypothetical protein ACP5KN_20460 [Armatimonadota bacterium]
MMREIVTVEQVESVLVALAWGLPIAGLAIGAIVGRVRGRAGRGAAAGLAFGMLGPIVWVMWLLYGYMVRYQPQTGRAGLHSVSVHALAALLFIVVGVLLGAAYRRIIDHALGREEQGDAAANETDAAEPR